MNNSISKELSFENEKELKHLPGSIKRTELEAELLHMKTSMIDIPLIIDGKEIRTENRGHCRMPHNFKKMNVMTV